MASHARIDTHQHYISEFYRALLARAGRLAR